MAIALFPDPSISELIFCLTGSLGATYLFKIFWTCVATASGAFCNAFCDFG